MKIIRVIDEEVKRMKMQFNKNIKKDKNLNYRSIGERRKNYHFGKANEGPGQGFNDAGLDKFRKSKSLYAEGEQNVCDNADEKVNEPCNYHFFQTRNEVVYLWYK